MNYKIILFALLSIVQFSACNPISTGSSHCANEIDRNFGPFISVNCDGAVFSPNTCANLTKEVNISSVSTVSFQNCDISDYSDILNQFPNIRKLEFLKNNSLPSIDFSHFSHLEIFHNGNNKLKTTPASLSINATNLEWFSFENMVIDSISMKNAEKLKLFYLENITISSLPADLLKNSTNLRIVCMHKNNIEKVNIMSLPSSVHWIDLSVNKIGQLTKNSFKNLTNLQVLLLLANGIVNVEEGTFSDLNNLYFLQLNQNHFKEIRKNTLKGLNNLVFIELQSNSINHIEDGAFESTPKLFDLNLSQNNISSLNPKTLAGLDRLIILKLNANPIRELTTESFGNLSQLRVLKMRSGILETVDLNVFANLPKLGYLDLSQNRISRLVKMFPNRWNSDKNTINTYQNDLNEAIDEIDFEWTKPIFAKAGRFVSRRVKYMFEAIIHEPSMKKFFIDEKLSRYSELGKGPNYGLKKLYLSDNQLTEVEKNIFEELKNLKVLYLSGNPITTLYPESFVGLNELEVLNLGSCKLTSVDLSMFEHLTQLQTLDLYGNQLKTIEAVPLPSINKLGLEDNQLTDLPMNKSYFPNLKELKIQRNLLNCSNVYSSFTEVEVTCY